MLVLEAEFQHPARVLADALDPGAAPGEAALGAPAHVDHLAGQQMRTGEHGARRAHRVDVRGARLAHGGAEPLGERQRGGDEPVGELVAPHHGVGAGDLAAELHADGPRDALGGVVGDGVDDDAVALVVGERHRGVGDPDQAGQHHLRLGEGPAHRVAVHQRQPRLGGAGDGQHGVDAADLDRRDVGGGPADVLLQGAQGGHFLATGRDPFQQHRGRPHPRDGHHGRVGRHLVEGDEPHRAVLPDGLAGQQLADVRVAAAAGAEDAAPRAMSSRLSRLISRM